MCKACSITGRSRRFKCGLVDHTVRETRAGRGQQGQSRSRSKQAAEEGKRRRDIAAPKHRRIKGSVRPDCVMSSRKERCS